MLGLIFVADFSVEGLMGVQKSLSPIAAERIFSKKEGTTNLKGLEASNSDGLLFFVLFFYLLEVVKEDIFHPSLFPEIP